MPEHDRTSAHTPFDYLLLGGGLQSCLLILAVRHHRPQASIAVVEQGSELAGNHTWCLHDGDVSGPARQWLWPALSVQWPGYTVQFPEYQREIPLGYSALTSADLREHALAALRRGPHRLLLNTAAQVRDNTSLQTASGEVLHGRRLLVASGQERHAHSQAGWQTFLGLELQTAAPHGLHQPILMDAKLPQLGGFRFMYVLPLGPDRLLVEDTCFADSPALDHAERRRQVLDYASKHAWLPATELRCETGVLAMPWQLPEQPQVDHARGGVLGGWFHPLTGYSLPFAAAVAQHLAMRDPGEPLGPAWQALQQRHRRQARLATTLNWALFRMAEPHARRGMLAHFYRSNLGTIGRVYALQHKWFDALALLAGRPPKGMAHWPRPLPALARQEATQ
jgi:lycopene beta-cyclase